MKITKSTWLDVGDGSPIKVYEALRGTTIPSDARLVALDTDNYYVEDDGGVVAIISHARLKYEWDDEE